MAFILAVIVMQNEIHIWKSKVEKASHTHPFQRKATLRLDANGLPEDWNTLIYQLLFDHDFQERKINLSFFI